MNRRHLVSSVLAAALLLPCAVAGARAGQGAVEIDIVGVDGRRFATFPVHSGAQDVHRAYLEARDQARYRIRVRNCSGQRVGLVIAVDGRNIISGEKSELARGERMYILDPWESAQYEGWRTGSERVNEFYFTAWEDSYAEAFGDRSARGVIAAAVYYERVPHRALREADPDSMHAPSAAAPAAGARSGAQESSRDEASERRVAAAPGTGFGGEVYSPVRLVQFEPQRRAAARHFIKYEWREGLCRKGVLDCEPRERNRFWNEDSGYAPYPPRRG